MGIVIPQVVTSDRASGAQVIDGSVRFDSRRSQSLTRTPGSAGNRKTWTYSVWVKTVPGSVSASNHKNLLSVDSGSASDSERMHLFLGNASDKIQHDLHGSSPRVSSARYRDVGGWYHVVVKFDSTQAVARGQIAWYINGEQVVNWDTESALTQNGDYAVNGAYLHRIGANNAAGPGQFWDGRMSQVYMVDGLALGPEYFGYTDLLTNTWRPKKFRAEGTTINNGTVWSSGTVNGTPYSGSTTWDKAFDGNLTGTGAAGGVNTANEFNLALPNIDITNKNVTIYANSNSADVWLNGKQLFMNDSVVYSGSVYQKSFTSSDIGSTTLTQIGLDAGLTVYGVAIDGVIMKDSTTQNLAFGTNGFYLPMDGNSLIGEDKSGNGNNFTPVNFGGSVALDNPIVSGARPILNTDGGGNVARPGVFGSEEGFYETVSSSSGGGNPYIFDGRGTQPTLSFVRGATYVFDYSSATSHPLRFATAADAAGSTQYTNGTNTSVSNVISFTVPHNAPNTLYYYCTNHGGMGNSISVTTDETKADLYAWKNVLALPLVGSDDDVSNSVNSGSTTKAVTPSGALASSAASNFYGGSYYFDGSNDELTIADSADWDIGSGDFTMEFWMYQLSITNTDTQILNQWGATGTSGVWYIRADSLTSMTAYFRDDANLNNGGATVASVSGTIKDNKWQHIAVSRDGTNLRMFVDGVLQNTTAMNFTVANATESLRVGRQGYTSYRNGQPYNGYLSDIRFYKGVAKYTSNFIPGSTDPDILPDTPSGVSGGSKLTKITDGAVSFDGATDDLNVPSHSDITFGTGIFTIDCFVYFNSFDDTYPTIMSKYTNAISWILRVKNDGKIVWYSTNGSGTNNESSTTPISLKKWQHIAVVREGTGSNQLKIYVDGKLHLTMTDANDYNDSNVLCIGAQQEGGGNGLNGYISNVRLVKGTAVYTSEFTPPFRTLTNVTNTKLLCCQSPTDETAAAVIPTGKINDTTISGYRQSSGTWDGSSSASSTSNALAIDVRYWSDLGTNRFIDQVTFDVVASGQSSDSGVNYIIYYTTSSSSGGSSVCNSGCTATSIPVPTGTSPGTYSVTVTFPSRVTARYIAVTNGKSTAGGTYVYSNVKIRSNVSATTFNPFTTDINAVRGQETGYPTFNPLYKISGTANTYSDGNLVITAGDNNSVSLVNMSMPTSGKWYAEITDIDSSSGGFIGGVGDPNQLFSDFLGRTATGWGYQTHASNASYYNNNAYSTAGQINGFGNNTVLNVAVDRDNGYLWFGINGAYVNGGNPSAGTGYLYSNIPLTGDLNFGGSSATGKKVGINCGQKPFKFPPPDGFQSLNAANARPETVIARPDQFVKPVLYDGNNGTKQVTTGLQADFIWIKGRSETLQHRLVDSVRGDFQLHTNSNAAQSAWTGLDILSNGFNVTNDGNEQNKTGTNYVAWTWRAGGGTPGTSGDEFWKDGVQYASAAAVGLTGITSPATLTAASIGTKQGFSIIKWNRGADHPTWSTGVIPHGLTQSPGMIITKNLGSGTGWMVFHSGKGTGRLYLNSNGTGDGSGYTVLPTATHFTIDSTSDGATANDCISYIWHDVPGLQKFGKYKCNGDGSGGGDEDGSFVELGFRPSMILFKGLNYTSDWTWIDNVRCTINYNDVAVRANYSNAEIGNSRGGVGGSSQPENYAVDFLSNGFKIRASGGSLNSGTNEVVYAAWAEVPVSGLYGSQSNAR